MERDTMGYNEIPWVQEDAARCDGVQVQQGAVECNRMQIDSIGCKAIQWDAKRCNRMQRMATKWDGI